MRKVRSANFTTAIARPSALIIVMIALIVGVFSYRLGNLTPAASAQEAEFAASARSVRQISDNPLYLYQKVGNTVLSKLDKQSLTTSRALNAALGILATIAMYVIIKRWYTFRVAVLATILFVSSSWLLYTTRTITPEISYLLPLGLILSGVWIRDGRYIRAATAIAAGSALLLLYVPAMIWVLLAWAIWQKKYIRQIVMGVSSTWRALIVTAFAIGATPLIWSFLNTPSLVYTWMGLPAEMPTVTEYLKNLARIPLDIFVLGGDDVTTGINGLPRIDILTSVMVVLGLYSNVYKIGLDRTKLIIGLVALGVLLVALSGPVNISFLLPYIYLAAAGGIALLLQQWFTVFPRNPLARHIGVLIVSIAIGLACYFHITKYFVVWPSVPETKAAFQYIL